MVAEYLRWIVGGFLAPQPTLRRLLSGGHGYDVAVQLFVLAFLIEAMSFTAFGIKAGTGSFIVGHLGNLVTSTIAFALLTFLVLRLGRLAGGTGLLPEAVLAMAWYSLMSSLLSPLVVSLMADLSQALRPAAANADEFVTPEISTSSLMAFVFAGITSIWLLANAVVAVHGFRNIWGVIGVIVGVPCILLFLATMLTGGAPR